MSAVLRFKDETPRAVEATCSTCSMRQLCLPAGMCAEEVASAQHMVYARRRVKAGAPLFSAGDPFSGSPLVGLALTRLADTRH